jgi:lipopolysaccharide/colanic/teichoic acid biosynthesis glycosyltransferase
MYKHFFKRFLDIILSGLALLCLSPVLLVVTIWLHFANKGAGAFFLQRRPGLNGKIFRVIKYKTMTDEKDAKGNLLPDADRLTKVGKFVRSTSIDEIPQLINVFKGDMSLIGPRPLTVDYLHVFNYYQSRRHEVRPGITGWAQINGRAACKLSKKFEYDVWYVDNCSFVLDCKIIAKTILAVFKRTNIGEGNSQMTEIDDLGMSAKIADYYKNHPNDM